MILLQQDFHSFPTPVSGSDNGDYLKRNTLDSIFTFETHSLFLFLIYKYLCPGYDIAILTSTDRTELFKSNAVMQG